MVGDVGGGGGEGEAGHQLLAEQKHQVSGLWEARYVIVKQHLYFHAPAVMLLAICLYGAFSFPLLLIDRP